MTRKERTLNAIEILKKEYPDAICSLTSSNPFELLVATRLSAQCTDARVNLVTPTLFERYKTLDDYANAEQSEVEDIIKSCGFYRDKAKSIIGMAQKIRDDFGGVVPDNIDDLITLPGVGRKTANLIVGDVYGKESIVVDTHMIRISNRIGLVNVKEPVKIEMALKKVVPADEGAAFCHRIVLFGRDVCSARKPKCDTCPMFDNCKRVGVK
ncbi:MAG: endonuclease III [Eubacterium sp.]|nr:endonuclease III [Eubacterium sp.]MBQ8980735.1 endonuclease III [Eubacterium sp.]MBR1532071.1 endonuclease III [Eubacterium sp.]